MFELNNIEMRELPKDIINLVLTYTLEPAYWFPDWIDKKHHDKLLFYSGSNPRAARYIVKTPINKITEELAYMAASNPNPKIIPLIKQGIKQLVNIDLASSLISNPTTDQDFIQFICEYLDTYLETHPFVNSHSSIWTRILPRAKYAGIQWARTKIDLILESKLGWHLSGIPDDFIIRKITTNPSQMLCYTHISSNPANEAIKFINQNPNHLDVFAVQKNPNPIIIQMIEKLVKQESYEPDISVYNIYEKLRNFSNLSGFSSSLLAENTNPLIVHVLNYKPELRSHWICSSKDWANQLNDVKINLEDTIYMCNEWIIELYRSEPSKFIYPSEQMMHGNNNIYSARSLIDGKINIYVIASRNIYLMGKNKYAGRLIKKLKLSNGWEAKN